MSGFTPEFLDHLDGECTTLCHCWRLERRDGRVFFFTDHDETLKVDGDAYEPGSGLSQSEARTSLGMAVDAVDVEGALSSDILSEEDIDAGLFDGARVTTLLVNWLEPQEFAVVGQSVVGRIVRAGGRFVAELESPAASLDRPNGRFLRHACDASLGDARCGVNLSGSGFNGTGAVLGLADPATLRVSGLDGFEVGWFAHGAITWTSGSLTGRSVPVVDHVRSAEDVRLVLPVTAATPDPGTGFTIVAGCDKSFPTCKAKFANAVNFRGFPHFPGNDAAYGYVSDQGRFDGRPIVE